MIANLFRTLKRNTSTRFRSNSRQSNQLILHPEQRSLLDLPYDVLFYLFDIINDPEVFYMLSRSCRTLLQISLDSNIQERAKIRMSKQIHQVTYSRTVSFFILPNGYKHGEYTEIYNSTGQLCEKCFYLDNKMNGEYKAWYSDGTLSEVCYFKNDSLDGEYRSYHMNGRVSEICIFSKDTPIGDFMRWSEDGSHVKKMF